MIVSILITIFIVALLFSTKKKPTTAPQSAPANSADFEGQTAPRTPKKKQPKMRKSESISPKNEGYFTYETLEPEIVTSPVSSSTYPNPSADNSQQITENEQQNKIELQFDEDEIQKGIIYSIILEKPEF